MAQNYDFSGYATRNDIWCSDGRVIRKDAFKDNDGATVPLVYMHNHTDPEAVLGHAVLENREDGVYAYCKFNDSEKGQHAKESVKHGDVRCLSIWANKLKQVGSDVVHGMIREVSLVMVGANPGATIDFVMAHSDDMDSAELYANYDESALVLYHSDDENITKGEEKVSEEAKKTETKETKESSEKTVADVFNEMTEEQKTVVYALIGQALEEAGVESSEEKDVQHSEEEVPEEEIQHSDNSEKTVADVFNEFTEEQKTVVYAMIGQALEEAGVEENQETNDDEEVEHSELGGEGFMKTNVFDKETQKNGEFLSHDEMAAIMDEARDGKGKLSDSVISHGIEDLDIMFPDAKALANEPQYIKRNDDWVAKVLGGVHHSPFAKIKSIFADITKDQARAKGYIKGNKKIEEVFKLLKRETNPTTIYKKQKLDRDDIIDIDWNVLPFLKGEMRMMLDEELARAILIGDGRNPVDEANDKINEECIRPIWKMEDLFTVKVEVPVAADASSEDKAKAFIKACIKSRKSYKGSGNPDMFMSEDMLTDCLLIEDMNGRTIYDSVQKLASVLRVREIVPVPVMENQTRTDDDDKSYELAAIYVNLKDYNVGTKKGGEVNFFSDFDIDFNQEKYLMETRCSGTLIKPYSAVAIEFTTANA